MMLWTRRANSWGCPRRDGNGTDDSSCLIAASGNCSIIGVRNRPEINYHNYITDWKLLKQQQYLSMLASVHLFVTSKPSETYSKMRITWCYGNNTNALFSKISSYRQCHANHSSLWGRVCCLTNLQLKYKCVDTVQYFYYFNTLFFFLHTCPSKAAMLAVLIITPRCPSASGAFFPIKPADNLITLKVPIKFTWNKYKIIISIVKTVKVQPKYFFTWLTSMVFWNVLRSKGWFLLKLYILDADATPAQLTATSRRPNLSSVVCNAFLTSCSEVTWNYIKLND